MGCENSDTLIDKLRDNPIINIDQNDSLTDENNTTKGLISSINQQPIAIITIDDNSTFKEDVNITLDGSKSKDADGKIISYSWLTYTVNNPDSNSSKAIIGDTNTLTTSFGVGVHIIELVVKGWCRSHRR